jgi:micrococcal nuclease
VIIGRSGRLLALLVTSLAAVGCRSGLPAPGGPSADAGSGVVVSVVDGDTVDVSVGGRTERVRLIGIDTPESVARHRPVQCFGVEASAELARILPDGSRVRLARDAVGRDRYDRLLAYVYREADGLLVNLALVERGFADAVTFGDNEALLDTMAAAEARARSTGAGLWSACGGPDVDIGPATPG